MITYKFNSHEETSEEVAELIIKNIKSKNDSLLCLATGNSPTKTYEKIVNYGQNNISFFNKIRIIKLDEWGGLPENMPHSSEFYLRKKVLDPLKIDNKRYISFNSNPVNPEEECERIENELDHIGPIDICILGIGINGHIGFNEPNINLNLKTHKAILTKQTLDHQMIKELKQKPKYGLTLGMKAIFDSKLIILLLTGKNKEKVKRELFSDNISTEYPVTILKLHPNLHCFYEEN